MRCDVNGNFFTPLISIHSSLASRRLLADPRAVPFFYVRLDGLSDGAPLCSPVHYFPFFSALRL